MNEIKFFKLIKNIKSVLATLTIAAIFISNLSYAQTASISWQLKSNPNVSTIVGPLYGYNQTLSGLVVNKYNTATGEAVGNCQFVDIIGGHWPLETHQVSDRYIQFSVTPKAGITFNINSISFYYSGAGGHMMRANVYYSTDSTFTTATQLNPAGSPLSNSDNPGDVKLYNYSISSKVEYGKIFYLRIYPWYEGNLFSKYVCLQNVIISGTTSGQVIPVLPIVLTEKIYNVSTTTAICSGNISFDGESNITAKGICWNTTGNPTIRDNHISNGPGLGRFEIELIGLEKSTKYFVCAYAENAAGINYGSVDSLITLNQLTIPIVETGNNVKIVGRSVKLDGIITGWGGSSITEKGICYNKTGNPTINDYKKNEGSGSESFQSIIQGLTNNTKFYARAYAINSQGVGYGNVKEFLIPSTLNGAYADGIHLDTKVIQTAIDSCSVVHGTVKLTNGIYLSSLLKLKSNVTFEVDSTATLLATTNRYDYYPAGFDTSGGKLPSSVTNFITSDYSDNITITGNGKIDGNGSPWWDIFRTLPTGAADLRPRLIQLNHGKHIKIENITLTNSPKFHLVPSWCYDVLINNVKIISPSNSPNTDAIDPATSHNVRITNCYLDVGDDNVALKSGSKDPSDPNAGCSNVLVENCTILHGHGISIGSETNGGVDSLVVRNCTFNGTDNGIRIKSNRTRGGNVRNAVYSNITMNNVANPILLDAYYDQTADQNDPPKPITSLTPYFHDITIKDVTITNCPRAGRIIGLPETPMTKINFENVNISSTTGLTIRNATVNMIDSKIDVTSGSRIILEKNGFVNYLSEVESKNIPVTFYLAQNYPNPFNPITTIKFSIPSADAIQRTELTTLKIFDMLGREISTLINEQKMPGDYSITFDGSALPSGIYFYRIISGSFSATKKMILLK